MKNNELGYSLIELLVVCVIMALVTKAALSGFPELILSAHRNSARQQLEFDLQRARSDSVAEGIRITFSVNAGGNSYSIGKDEFPFSSTLSPDELLYTRTLPTNFIISSSTAFAYSSSGYLVDGDGGLIEASLTLSDGSDTFLTAALYPAGGMEYE